MGTTVFLLTSWRHCRLRSRGVRAVKIIKGDFKKSARNIVFKFHKLINYKYLTNYFHIATMPQCCAVPLCSERKGGHMFPRDKTVLEQWLVAIRRKNYCPTKHSRVCKKHFNPEDYVLPKESYTENPIPRLKPKVVPSKFSWNQESEERKEMKRQGAERAHQRQQKKLENATLSSNIEETQHQHEEHFASLGSQRVVKDTTLPDTSPRVLPVPVSQKAEAAGSLVYNAKVPATSAGLRCAECGGAVAGRVFACVQCAGAGMCAACGGGAGGRHRRHAVLRLPSRRIYNKVRDLFESLQKEFAKLGLDDASDDESLNSDDDEVPIGNDDDDDDDEEESKDWEQSLTVPVTSSPSRKRKRKTKSYASTAPKDISRATATEVTNEDSNIMDDTDVDEPLVLFKQPPLDDHPDPLSEVKIEPDEPPEETAAVVITEVSVVKSGIISEVPTTVQTNKEIKVYKTYSVKTKRRSGLNEGTSRETDAAAEDRARAEIKTKVKEEPPEEMAEGEDCSSFIEYGSHKPTKS
ncbi:unnamed protein product [Plutella xylostella]|uniref:(diamondback moth) hypothetical protein n=1 Tax=Plutella xylostella TaxID=51655 RepID=A0A8S4E2X6_PLUXY|nr:unnamed protein product [Plutella xylostella]